ncbi:MAG: helix-turn-helix domain-containing protein [Nannocystis sp.]|nr:helix-turn-helix domain-containing protein [Nannocystis sp.]
MGSRARWRGGFAAGEDGGDDGAAELPRILYVQDLADLLGRSEKAVRHAMRRGLLPEPLKLAGRLAWRRADVLSWVSEIHGVSRSEPFVNISIHPYDHDPSRFRVTFEIPKTPGEPRRRLRKVAPAGLDHAAALDWARRQSREIWAELMGVREEVRPPTPSIPQPPPQPQKTPPRAPLRPSAAAPTGDRDELIGEVMVARDDQGRQPRQASTARSNSPRPTNSDTTCDGGPCRITNLAENTQGLVNLVCECK